jgi:ABC-type transporter Mla subunit MlaD
MNHHVLEPMKQFLVLFAALFSLTIIQAQNNSICEEGDCPSSLFSIQLDEPFPAGTASNDRTERFQQAFITFQQIKKTFVGKEDWQDKRDESQLGGKSCLRYYQLESHFALEYTQNPDFKQFVDGQGANGTFADEGFQSSRRGLNLSKRMQDNCPNEVNDVKKKKSPDLDDLPHVYQKLGEELGYFNDKGQLLKPLDPPAPAAGQDVSKMSKKQQVEYLKNQVNQLPVGQETKDKISGVKNDLANAKPKLGLLKGALGLLNSRLGTFLPGPLGLVGKMKTLNDALGVLKNFVPKISVPGLLSKIGNLFKRGKNLGDKAKGLADKSQKLKDKYDDISKKTDDLQDKMADRESAIDKLQSKLDELAKKKDELTKQLEDKPKKILDELHKKVGDVKKEAGDLVDEVKKETQLKDELLDKLEELTKAKDDAQDELDKLEEEMKDLAKEQEELAKETKEVEQEVEEVKKQEEMVDNLKKEMEDLKPEEKLKGEIADCESELNKLLAEITGMDQKQEKVKKKLGGLLSLPGKLMDKVSNLKLFQDKLKLPQNGIPVADKTLAKLDGLSEKATAIGSIVEILTGKKSKLQTTVEGLDAKLENIKKQYDSKTANLDELKKELVALIAEKSGIKGKMDQGIEDVKALEATVRDFIDRYNIFDKKADCEDNKELEEKIEDTKKEQEQTEPEVDELEKDLNDADQQTDQLEEQTQELEKEIGEQVQQEEELKQEEETLKEEYGTDVKLEPVTVEEWAESFEVERPYWEATFHPDDEVVEGQKGRYFEVKLKDADKNVKLLFGPGEYCMSKTEFRKKYGSTIGSFVAEALHAMKKADQSKVKLFIQGSADIAGHTTFSGKLDEQFFYENISVLPQRKDDNERFESAPIEKEIPDRNFRNDHLPDLRGQYLKEMIKVYSKKFEPVVLEGIVKDFKDEGERNAIIYLFIPEELVSEYGN